MSNIVKSVVIDDGLIEALKVACVAIDEKKRDCFDMIDTISKTPSPVNDDLIMLYRDDIDSCEKAERLFYEILSCQM